MVKKVEFLEAGRVRVLDDGDHGLDPRRTHLPRMPKPKPLKVHEDHDPIQLRVDVTRRLVHRHEKRCKGFVQRVLRRVPVLYKGKVSLKIIRIFCPHFECFWTHLAV